MPGPSTWPAL
jgi:hypothetical protein